MNSVTAQKQFHLVNVVVRAFIILILGACHRDTAIFIPSVYFANPLPDGLSEDPILELAKTVLRENGFNLKEASKHNYAGKLDLQRAVKLDDKDERKDFWRFQIQLVPIEIDQTTLFMEGHGESLSEEALPTTHQLMAMAKQAVGEITAQRKLLREPLPVLLTSLKNPSPRMRDFVIRLAGARKIKSIVPELCAHLSEETDVGIMLHVVGALVQIGDERAISPLVEMTKRKHPIFINQIVFAVSSIGGTQAEAYLDTLAQGHPSEEVQEAAKDALQELLTRKTLKASVSQHQTK